jgi:hypothetical protein
MLVAQAAIRGSRLVDGRVLGSRLFTGISADMTVVLSSLGMGHVARAGSAVHRPHLALRRKRSLSGNAIVLARSLRPGFESLRRGSSEMGETTIDRNAMGRLAKALAFICGGRKRR